jgi:hypothetical protein
MQECSAETIPDSAKLMKSENIADGLNRYPKLPDSAHTYLELKFKERIRNSESLNIIIFVVVWPKEFLGKPKV